MQEPERQRFREHLRHGRQADGEGAIALTARADAIRGRGSGS